MNHEQPLPERAGYLLKIAEHALRIRMDEALMTYGITTPQYAVLSVLMTWPERSNADLARRVFLTPQTTNEIVRNLMRDELITREPDADHGRILRYTITEQGEEIWKRANEDVLTLEQKMAQNLSEEDHAQLLRLLHACITGLESA